MSGAFSLRSIAAGAPLTMMVRSCFSLAIQLSSSGVLPALGDAPQRHHPLQERAIREASGAALPRQFPAPQEVSGVAS
jgi:hypothetical protein